MAATIYDLKVIERAIEDDPINVTRFVIISNQETKPSGNDRTSILFRAKHEPGALCRMLEPLKDRNLNLLWLDYRPSREQHWEYVFFLDIAGHREDPLVKEALAELSSRAIYLRVLGSFPLSVEERNSGPNHAP
jgi:chorismate mutase/prephenate dehydratase